MIASPVTWHTVASEPSELGESPFWHPNEQTLYWVDIPGKKILRANVFMGIVEQWPMPSEPGCIAPAATGGVVIALRDGIYRAHEWGGPLTLMARAAHDTATTRFNDGKADPLGRFWAGSMYEPRDKAAAELFSLECRAGRSPDLKRMAANATVANGLAWSPDAKTIYWSDTLTHVIRAWNWDADDNVMSASRVFHQFDAKPADWAYGRAGFEAYKGRPDGGAMDVEGNYYAAMFEGKRLCKFAPDGELLAEIPVPVMCPTMPCFGGDDLQTLYLTTARHGRSAHELAELPLSGCVLSLRVNVPGLPVNFFKD